MLITSLVALICMLMGCQTEPKVPKKLGGRFILEYCELAQTALHSGIAVHSEPVGLRPQERLHIGGFPGIEVGECSVMS